MKKIMLSVFLAVCILSKIFSKPSEEEIEEANNRFLEEYYKAEQNYLDFWYKRLEKDYDGWIEDFEKAEKEHNGPRRSNNNE